MLAQALAHDGDPVGAQQLLEDSARTFRELGDEHSALHATYNLAVVSRDLGDEERYRELLEENLHRARALGDRRTESMSLGGLASFARNEGRLQDAVSMIVESARIERDLGDVVWIANNLGRLAYTFAVEGRPGIAARLLSNAEALHEQVGVSWAAWAAEMNEETTAIVRTQLDEGAFAVAWEHGGALTLDEALALALDAAD